MTKPGIIYGNLITAAAGFFLASENQIFWTLLAETLAGISLVIGAACVFNNYIDRDIDKKMARTSKRAIPSGTISGPAAITFGIIMAAAGFIILGIFTNWLVFGLGAAAIFFYVVLYGLAKRRSVHGTLVGSIPGAAPPAAGYLAVTNHIDKASVLLFLVLVCWQMPHFYAIAMYRYKDYKSAGLPVLPVKRGMKAARTQIIAYIAAFVIAAALLTLVGPAGYVYLAAMLITGGYWLYKAIKDYHLGDIAWGRRMFLISLVVNLGWSMFAALGARLP